MVKTRFGKAYAMQLMHLAMRWEQQPSEETLKVIDLLKDDASFRGLTGVETFTWPASADVSNTGDAQHDGNVTMNGNALFLFVGLRKYSSTMSHMNSIDGRVKRNLSWISASV